MAFRYKKILQTTTLFLVMCMANGYLFAFMPDGNRVETNQPKAFAAGVLNAFEASSVRVNGNSAQDGMTILSGAEIKTNNASGASVDLRGLGKIEISPETAVKVFFTAEQVDLRILSGKATLTALRGVNGIVTNSDGTVLKTDASAETSKVGDDTTVAPGASAPVPVVENTGLFGMGLWGTVAVAGGVIGGTVLAVVAADKSDDVSKSPVSRVRP